MLLRLAVSAILSALAVTSAAFAQDALQREIFPMLRSYERCATRHLENVSAQQPNSTFDQHEASIRPQCGRHIENVRGGMVRLGYSAEAISAEIRDYYDALRPKLVALFYERARVAQDARQLSVRSDVAQRVREIVMRSLDTDYRVCVNDAIRAIVPYSTDSADVLVETTMAKCMDYERRRAEFIEVLYDIPQDEASRAVQIALQNEKRRILADIVTVRAALNKAAAQQASPAEPGTTGSIARPAKGY